MNLFGIPRKYWTDLTNPIAYRDDIIKVLPYEFIEIPRPVLAEINTET
jgi:hypothetical protein